MNPLLGEKVFCPRLPSAGRALVHLLQVVFKEKWVKSDVFPALAAIFHTLRSCEVTPAAMQKHSAPEPWTGEQEGPLLRRSTGKENRTSTRFLTG